MSARKGWWKTANTVTEDILTFSQPFIHEGALLSSSTSGRRLFIHHLSEVPLGTDVFTTHIGNQLKRTDKNTVAMGDIKLDIKPFPEGIANVPTPKIISQVPTAAFTGPAEARDKMAVQLINKGKEANAAGEFATACACFESAYALAMRVGMLVSAANMRLKLGQWALVEQLYLQIVRMVLTDAQREIVERKLNDVAALKAGSAPMPGASAPGPSVPQEELASLVAAADDAAARVPAPDKERLLQLLRACGFAANAAGDFAAAQVSAPECT